MKIENLIPTLELCKRIPAGEFEDSAFVWRLPESSLPPKDEFYNIFVRDMCGAKLKNKQIPAPTLEEIMSSMPFCRVYKRTVGCYVAVYENVRIQNFNESTAALKLWMKLKGVEYEQD